MLALVRSSVWAQVWKVLLLSCAAAALASCATKEPPPLISDSSASHETALPWNEQQKWEREGQAAAITQQRR
jgi:predicted ATPase